MINLDNLLGGLDRGVVAADVNPAGTRAESAFGRHVILALISAKILVLRNGRAAVDPYLQRVVRGTLLLFQE